MTSCPKISSTITITLNEELTLIFLNPIIHKYSPSRGSVALEYEYLGNVKAKEREKRVNTKKAGARKRFCIIESASQRNMVNFNSNVLSLLPSPMPPLKRRVNYRACGWLTGLNVTVDSRGDSFSSVNRVTVSTANFLRSNMASGNGEEARATANREREREPPTFFHSFLLLLRAAASRRRLTYVNEKVNQGEAAARKNTAIQNLRLPYLNLDHVRD